MNNQQVKPIQGLYNNDAQHGNFYSLLAKVLLAKFSEKLPTEGRTK